MPTPICAMRRSTFAAPLMALAALTASDASAHAAAECIATPKGGAPQGSHWYYRWDREGQRRCWYVAAWKGARTGETARVKMAAARSPVPQVWTEAQQHVTDPSPATLRDETARQSNEDRIRRLLYGTEQRTEGDTPPLLELRRSLTPVQAAVADDGARATGTAPSLLVTPTRAPDEVTSDTSLLPAVIAAQTRSAATPAQTALYLITILALAGGLLHVSTKFMRARRQRTRITRRTTLMLASPRHAPRALPPDRVRRFA
jgi:hypothetical protein